MMKLMLSLVAAVILALVGYALGAEIVGNTIGAILFAIVGFAVGWWVAAMALARSGRRGSV